MKYIHFNYVKKSNKLSEFTRKYETNIGVDKHNQIVKNVEVSFHLRIS